MKKNIIFLSFFLLIVLCIIFYPLTIVISKNKTKELQFLEIEKVKAQINALLPYFNKNIEAQDDINLIKNIENLSRLENIASCFILDSKNKALIHNNTSQWGKDQSPQVYGKALAQKTFTVQKTDNDKLLSISQPLVSDCMLCCIVSIKKAQESAKYWKIRYFTISITITILILISFYFLAKLIILFPFNRIKKSLEDQYLKDPMDENYNEITDIFIKQKDEESKKIQILLQKNNCLGEIIKHIQNEHKDNKPALIILDSFNQIVYAYDTTNLFLKKNFKINDHIFESSSNTVLMKAISFLNQNLGYKVVERFQNFTITAQAIKDSTNTLSGIIIKVTV